jgi:hypothetical protein
MGKAERERRSGLLMSTDSAGLQEGEVSARQHRSGPTNLLRVVREYHTIGDL